MEIPGYGGELEGIGISGTSLAAASTPAASSQSSRPLDCVPPPPPECESFVIDAGGTEGTGS